MTASAITKIAGIGVVTLTAFTIPSIGSSVTGVLFSNPQVFANGMLVLIHDNSNNTAVVSLSAISGNSATITTTSIPGSSGAGTTITAGAYVFVVHPANRLESLAWFADGADGAFAPGMSGVTTLTRDMYWSSFGPWPSGSTAQLNTNGYFVFCNGTFSMANCPAGGIINPGGAGGSTTTGLGGTAGPAGNTGTLAAGTPGAAGAGSGIFTGSNGATTTVGNNGGTGGYGGTGGNGVYTGGSLAAVLNPVAVPQFSLQKEFITSASNVLASILGGGGGASGGAGGGNGTVSGGGSGGGGAGAGNIAIYCAELYRDSTTAVDAIISQGGAGGNGANGQGTNTGGGAGSGGGAGGWVFIAAGMISGTSPPTYLVKSTGGFGGVGGNGLGTGTGGNGGYGGGGGRIDVWNLGTGNFSSALSSGTGLAGGSASGNTGGTAGTPQNAQLNV